MTTEPSTSGPTLPWPIDAVVLGEVTWAARTVVELVGVGGELLLSPQSVEIIKFGDPGSGR